MFGEETTIQFNIVNLLKSSSLYNKGMRPWVKSGSEEWSPSCTDIKYYWNQFLRNRWKHPPVECSGNELNQYYLFTLSFKYTFPPRSQWVSFAHAIPYTYSGLDSYIKKLSHDETFNSFLRVGSLCLTLGGNICPFLTITSDVNSYLQPNEEHVLMN